MMLKRKKEHRIDNIKKVNDQFQGVGTMKWETGTTMVGEWEEGKLKKIKQINSERGTWLLNGDVDSGYYGVKTRRSGRYQYTGQMNLVGLEHGRGKKVFANKTIYEGQFENGKFVHGKATYPDGMVYNGKFNENQQRHDKSCRITLPSGKVYEGSIFNDGQHGQGFVEEKFAEWKDGKIVE